MKILLYSDGTMSTPTRQTIGAKRHSAAPLQMGMQEW